MTIDDFYKNHINHGIDIDNTAGIQCVDLFKCFTKEFFGISNYNCGNGYANGLWLYRKSKPYYKYFDEVSINNLQNGDWCFWDKGSRDCKDSHVAMYYNGKFFGQNQAGRKEATLVNISKDGMLGALRPKIQNNNVPRTGADQVLHAGSKVQPYGCQIEDIKTIGNKTTFYSSVYGCWLPIEYFYRVGADGKKYPNQKSSKGNWLKSDAIFRVLSVSKNPDRAVCLIGNKKYNILSSGLYEVSDN